MRHCEEAILSERSESKDADEAIPKVLRGDRFAPLAMTQRLVCHPSIFEYNRHVLAHQLGE